MINNVCIEGFVGKKFQEGVIKTYPVLYFRLVHYGTGNNKNYQVINCQLIGTKVETFKKNVNKLLGIEEEKPKEGEDKTEDTKKE